MRAKAKVKIEAEITVYHRVGVHLLDYGLCGPEQGLTLPGEYGMGLVEADPKNWSTRPWTDAEPEEETTEVEA